jgi:hypothetical protein
LLFRSTMHDDIPEPMPQWPPRKTRRPAPAREPGAERFAERLRRRLRDLLIMAVVGPALGVCAIVAIHVATLRIPPPPPPVRAAIAPEAVPRLPPMATQVAPDIAPPSLEPDLLQADFGDVTPTASARDMADWIVQHHDNGKLPFMVLDKVEARLYVFEPNGVLVEDTPVLLGSARGDDTFPGIGNVPIKQVKPFQRTTAAGRFMTQPGLDIDRSDVVWLDYDAALAMHRVINKVKSERRPQRLASPTPADNRISYGCINIPIDFFNRRISPVFGKGPGVAYVIPEVKTFAEVFEHGGPGGSAVATLETPAKAPMDVGNR